MEIIKISSSSNNFNLENIVATIGEFDGLHLAHQALLKKTLEIAEEKNYKSALITFEPHPDIVLKKDLDYVSLLSFEEKSDIIKNNNFNYLIVITFDNNLSNMEHNIFVQKFLLELGVKELVVGYDFCYGFKGLGKAKSIAIDSNNQIKVHIIPEIIIEEKKVGSSLIKDLLSRGNVKKVKMLLGYNYRISGEVVHGRNIGEKIKVPTANLKLDRKYPKLKEGVYAGKCLINGQYYNAILNIGHNPSFNYYENLSYEIHIIEENFSCNLYGQKITLELIEYLREEQVFKNIEDFQMQICKDKNQANLILNNTL